MTWTCAAPGNTAGVALGPLFHLKSCSEGGAVEPSIWLNEWARKSWREGVRLLAWVSGDVTNLQGIKKKEANLGWLSFGPVVFALDAWGEWRWKKSSGKIPTKDWISGERRRWVVQNWDSLLIVWHLCQVNQEKQVGEEKVKREAGEHQGLSRWREVRSWGWEGMMGMSEN